jgi:hypothetical protein
MSTCSFEVLPFLIVVVKNCTLCFMWYTLPWNIFGDHPNELSQFAVFYDLQVISYEYNDILFAVFYSVFADT